MSFEDFKIITIDNAGSTLRYGGNDFKEIMQMLNGVVLPNRRPEIATPWRWLNNTLTIMNPANTFSYTIETSAITSDRKIILPAIASDATLILNTASNTFTQPQTFNGTQTVNKTAQAAAAELIATFQVSDGTSKIEILNASSTDAIFSPWIRSYNLDSTTPALYFYGYIGNALDTGGEAGMRFDVRKADDSALTTRPLFSFRTGGTEVFLIGQTSFGFASKNLTNIGTITANGLVTISKTAQATTAESLLTLKVTDSALSQVLLVNASAVDGQFIPWLQLWQRDSSAQPAYYQYGYIDAAHDTGTMPIVIFDARKSDSTTITTRPIYDFRAAATSVFKISPTQFDFTNKSLINIKDVQIRNPANTFGYSLVGSAITANRILTIPLLAADGKVVVDSFANIFTANQRISKSAQAGVAEIFQRWDVSDDASANLQLWNYSASDALFAPKWSSVVSNDSALPGWAVFATIQDAADTGGGAAVISYDARCVTIPVANRSLFAILNRGTTAFSLTATSIDLTHKLALNFDVNTITTPLGITATKTSAAGVGEMLQTWKVSDSTLGSQVILSNSSTTDARFIPWLQFYQRDTNLEPASYCYGIIDNTHDTGSIPVMILDVRTHTSAAIVTRPLYDFRTAATSVLKILTGGALEVKVVSSTPANPPTGYARIFIEALDANNDGVFAIIKKNSVFEKVQIPV